MRVRVSLLSTVFALCGTACGDGGIGYPGQNAPEADNIENGIEPSLSAWQWDSGVTEVEDDASSLFDRIEPIDIDLTVSPETWNYLNANALALDANTEFVKVIATIDGEALGEVGLRPKGASTLRRCFDAAGSQICEKLSLKFKFSEYSGTKRFRGLKRINLNSSIRDHSMLREYLAYGLYRRMGQNAPRVAHAEVRVNGESIGVFVMVEDVDGQFLSSRFPGNDNGNLYKDLWPAGGNPVLYSQRLETNEKTGNNECLTGFQNEIEGASDAELPDVLSRWMDVETLRTFVTIEQVNNNWDGPLSFSMKQQPALAIYESKNFFLYQEKNRAKFELIAWDMDHALSQHGERCPDMPAWNDLTVDCQNNRTRGVAGGRICLVPSCDPVLRALALSGPGDTLNRFLKGPFELEGLYNAIQLKEASLQVAIARDPTLTVDRWKQAIIELKSDLVWLHKRQKETVAH